MHDLASGDPEDLARVERGQDPHDGDALPGRVHVEFGHGPVVLLVRVDHEFERPLQGLHIRFKLVFHGWSTSYHFAAGLPCDAPFSADHSSGPRNDL